MNVAAEVDSPALLPAVYGLGTAVPVLVVAIVFSQGLSAFQSRLRSARWFTRRLPGIAGGLLVLSGIYLSVRDIILSAVQT
jgi:cytochrome c biogenesis protein CcdA